MCCVCVCVCVNRRRKEQEVEHVQRMHAAMALLTFWECLVQKTVSYKLIPIDQKQGQLLLHRLAALRYKSRAECKEAAVLNMSFRFALS